MQTGFDSRRSERFLFQPYLGRIKRVILLSNLLITVVALAGLALSFHIWRKKKRGEKLTCPLGSDCDLVVRSEFSTFWGLPLEFLGVTYYAAVTLSYLIFIIRPIWQAGTWVGLIYWATILAFLFSLYLTYVQLAKLKQWCTWCLLSAMFCTIIFLATLAV